VPVLHANLYLTLPLVSLLAFLLVRFAAERSSLTEQLFETIGALWLTGYLFALAGATVAHELTHRNNRFAKLSAAGSRLDLRRLEGRAGHFPRRVDRALVSRADQLRAALWAGACRKFADQAASQLGLLSDDLQCSALQFAASRRPSYVRHQSVLAVEHSADAPTLPYGYQTMAFIALTPPLWRHIMRPLLADWDKRFASDAERDVVRERGWEGVA
jgi:hypothetical protein